MTIDIDLTQATKAAFDATHPLTNRPSWQDFTDTVQTNLLETR